MTGWLVQQLPRVMGEDPVIRGFVSALEEVSDTVTARVDGIQDQFDVDLAPPEMLRYLASWLGVHLEPTDSAAYQRSLIRAVGRFLGWRGTRVGVQGLLEAATGCTVAVRDSGGVFLEHEDVPAHRAEIEITVEGATQLTGRQVRRLLEDELPLGGELTLVMSDPTGGAT